MSQVCTGDQATLPLTYRQTQRKYGSTEQGQETQRKYEASEKARERKRRYLESLTPEQRERLQENQREAKRLSARRRAKEKTLTLADF